jgi:membrane AbrB-like protein
LKRFDDKRILAFMPRRLALPRIDHRWLPLAICSVILTGALGAVHLPSAGLFAGLLCAMGFALAGRAPHAVPRRGQLLAQGLLGGYIGTLVQGSTLTALGSRWPAVLLIGVATLLLSVLAGALLGRHPGTDPLTGSLSLIAGGSSGLTAIARDLGGDQRTVAVIQYLRVTLVTATLPLVATLYPATGHGARVAAAAGGPPWWASLLFTAGVMVVGIPLGLAVRMPAGALLGPLIVSATVSLTGLAHGATVPVALVSVGYLVIGWQAGLGFTRESLRRIARLLPLATALIVAVSAGCAGLGLLLSKMTGVGALDGYLATTPGGIYAVLAVAAESHVDITFIVASQLVRILLMLFLAPWAARAFQAYRERHPAEPAPTRLRC